MSIVLTKELSEVIPSSNKLSRVQHLLRNWDLTRARLQGNWQQYRSSATGRHVPYRAWSRYSAYLEAQQEMHKH